MIADPVNLKRVHIACAVMLSFAACGIASPRKNAMEPCDAADSFIPQGTGQSKHAEGVKNADASVRKSGSLV